MLDSVHAKQISFSKMCYKTYHPSSKSNLNPIAFQPVDDTVHLSIVLPWFPWQSQYLQVIPKAVCDADTEMTMGPKKGKHYAMMFSEKLNSLRPCLEVDPEGWECRKIETTWRLLVICSFICCVWLLLFLFLFSCFCFIFFLSHIPAEPLKPEINSLLRSHEARYSFCK